MFTGLDVHIDQFSRPGDGGKRGLLDALERADKGQHRAVVIGVRAVIEQDHIGGLAHRRHDLLDDLRPAAF